MSHSSPFKILHAIANTPTEFSFEHAVKSGNVVLVWILLETGVTDYRALELACTHGFMDIARLLIDKNVPANVNAAFLKACKFGRIDVVRLRIERCDVDVSADENAALINAIEQGQTEIVRLLLDLPLDYGVDPAADDNFPLWRACASGYTKIVRLLLDLPLERGVDPTFDDSAAFRVACEFGQINSVHQLLDCRFKVDVAACDNAAFVSACRQGYSPVCSLNYRLIEKLILQHVIILLFFTHATHRNLFVCSLNVE